MRWFGKLVTGACLILFSLIIAFLAIHSLFFTSEIRSNETMAYLTDAPWVHALVIGALLTAAWLITRRGWPLTEKAENRMILCVMLAVGALSLFCVLVSQSLPIFDQQLCISAANSLAAGNLDASLRGYYLNDFPFQLPWVLILSVFSLLGIDHVLVYQLANIVANLVSVWALAECGVMLFNWRQVRLLTWLGALAFLPLMFYLPFVYGNLPGLSSMLLGARALLGYLRERAVKRLVAAVVLFTIATLIKKNFLVAAVATSLILVINLRPGKRTGALVAAAAMLAASLWGGSLLCGAVGSATGADLSQGFPTSSFILLGLQEEEGREPGWHNPNGYILYEKANQNTAAADAMARQIIWERLAQLAADPAYTATFFYRKVISQWEEPSFQSLWVNEMARNEQRGKLALSLYEHGKAGNAALWWMNQYHSVILVGVALWLVLDRKRASAGALFFPLYFVGGFLFHLVWEAKGQYTLFYFFCMIPYAVAGYMAAVRRLHTAVRKQGLPCEKCAEATTVHTPPSDASDSLSASPKRPLAAAPLRRPAPRAPQGLRR